MSESGVKICWLGKKHKGQFVCFIPLTIDGVGETSNKALRNLENESTKIVKAIRRAGIECHITEDMIHEAVGSMTTGGDTTNGKRTKK
jgi:hypothetical protein